MRSRLLRFGLPVVVLGLSLLLLQLMVGLRPAPAGKERERVLPRVETLVVEEKPVRLEVLTQGTVTPRTETVLISEVSGVIEWISPSLLRGGFFNAGETLLRVEKVEYDAAVANAERFLAETRLRYEQERARREQALKDWRSMGGGEGSSLVLREPQLRKAEADVAYAEAALAVAQRNLAFTEVRAPYAGRVRAKFVDVGQSVSPKVTQLARIYAIDFAEVRLSLTRDETALVDLPEVFADGAVSAAGPRVVLSANYGGRWWEWHGVIDRTEGEVDARTRLVYAVARVDGPYERSEAYPGRPPLKPGMFVTARIEGRLLERGFELPREAVQVGGRVHVLGEGDRLRVVPVEVVYDGVEKVVLSGGLKDGERVVLTPLKFVAEGMELDPEEATALR